jgi:asparagine synthase (glutamine-hydrolysing)
MSRVVQSHERAELLDPAFMHPGAEDEIAAVVRRQLANVPGSPLGETLHLDTRLALVDNMLLYFDKMSMATSLEVRVPFMDHKLVEFCTRLPDSRRVYHGRRKEILKRASRGLVEDAIIDKPKRGFFHSALGAWLGVHRDALVSETLLDGRALARGQYRADAVERLILEAGGEAGKKSSQRLFCLLLLERWQRIFVDGEAPGLSAEEPLALAS